MAPSKPSRGADAPMGRTLGASSMMAAAAAPGAPPGLASGVFSYAAGGAAGGLPAAVYPKDSVRDAADALGLSGVRDQVLGALAGDVEYRLRDLLQDAAKYMRHAKRAQLRTSDIDMALRAKNVEPLYGYFPATSGRSNATAAMRAPAFRKTPHPSGTLYYLEDEEIDFDDILHAGPVLALGKGVGWSSHWLAIEGVQPAVPQNPSPAELGLAPAPPPQDAEPSPSQGPQVVPASINGAPPGRKDVQVRPLVKHVLSRELQLYFERLTQAITSPPTSADAPPSEAESRRAGAPAAPQVEEDAAHSLGPASDGQAASLDKIAQGGSGNAVRDAALASLRGDPGLHQLVPYLVQWVGEKISFGLLDVVLLEHMMLVVHALLVNPHIFIEPYLHQLMPSVLSVLLTASMGEDPSIGTGYGVRAHTALLLAHIAVNCGRSYPSLRPRIVATLLKALLAGTEDGEEKPEAERTGGEALAASEAAKTAPAPSAATKLGALLGLRSLGSPTVQAFLLGPSGVDVTEDPARHSALERLAPFVQRLVQSDPEAAGWITREVRLALHMAAPPAGLPPTEAEAERILLPAYGPFWTSHFLPDPLARHALVAATLSSSASGSGDSEARPASPAPAPEGDTSMAEADAEAEPQPGVASDPAPNGKAGPEPTSRPEQSPAAAEAAAPAPKPEEGSAEAPPSAPEA